MSIALGLTMIAAPAVAQPTHVLVPADKVQWSPAPPALPSGAQISVLEGNPGEKGPVTPTLMFPANYDIPAHWHSTTERVTVLSGACMWAWATRWIVRPARRSPRARSCHSRGR